MFLQARQHRAPCIPAAARKAVNWNLSGLRPRVLILKAFAMLLSGTCWTSKMEPARDWRANTEREATEDTKTSQCFRTNDSYMMYSELANNKPILMDASGNDILIHSLTCKRKYNQKYYVTRDEITWHLFSHEFKKVTKKWHHINKHCYFSYVTEGTV